MSEKTELLRKSRQALRWVDPSISVPLVEFLEDVADELEKAEQRIAELEAVAKMVIEYVGIIHTDDEKEVLRRDMFDKAFRAFTKPPKEQGS